MTRMSVAEARSAMAALWAQQDEYNLRFPELQLRVWAAPEGMRCAAVMWLPGPKYGRKAHVVAEATWAPKEVTEDFVAEWGMRALKAWLERNADVWAEDD